MADNKLCFVIAPIGEPNSDTRKRSDQILKHVITPAANECGYTAIRADQISEPGIITSQVIQHVVDDPLVIADLTERNPNVFYELAIRHAIRKPLVQIIKRGEPLPFDVAGTRTISVDHRDLDSVEDAKKEIINQVKATEGNLLEIDTPISVALDLQLLKQSDDPEQRSLADILSALSEIRTSITSIEQRLATGESLGSRELLMQHLVNNLKLDVRPSSGLRLAKSEELTPNQLALLSKYITLQQDQGETRGGAMNRMWEQLEDELRYKQALKEATSPEAQIERREKIRRKTKMPETDDK